MNHGNTKTKAYRCVQKGNVWSKRSQYPGVAKNKKV